MKEELENLVAKTLPDPKTFRFYDNEFSCYIDYLHLTIRSMDKRFQFSLTHSDPETMTSYVVYSASGFNSLYELKEGLKAMGSELERRDFIEGKLNQESSDLEVESILDLVKTETVESGIAKRTSQPSETSKPIHSQKTKKESLKPVLIATVAVFILNIPLSFIFSRIWVQTMLQGVAEGMARDLIEQQKSN